jgi:hypothetical protein
VVISALYALLFYRPFQRYQAFGWSFFITLFIFLLLRAKDYYAIGLYPIYLAFGAVFIANQLNVGWKRYIQPVCLALPVGLFCLIYPVAFPNKPPTYIVTHNQTYQKWGLLRWEDGKEHALPQDYADMLGWKELATKADQLYASLPQPHRTLVLCDNYGQAGAINFYTRKGIKAVSFNADYLNWFDLQTPYVNLIRVKTSDGRNDELQETSPFFQTSFAGDSVTNRWAREHGTTLFVFAGARVDIRQRLKAEIDELNKRH